MLLYTIVIQHALHYYHLFDHLIYVLNVHNIVYNAHHHQLQLASNVNHTTIHIINSVYLYVQLDMSHLQHHILVLFQTIQQQLILQTQLIQPITQQQILQIQHKHRHKHLYHLQLQPG
jgi:hypothetical protein